jgi:hypothetical protein
MIVFLQFKMFQKYIIYACMYIDRYKGSLIHR